MSDQLIAIVLGTIVGNALVMMFNYMHESERRRLERNRAERIKAQIQKMVIDCENLVSASQTMQHAIVALQRAHVEDFREAHAYMLRMQQEINELKAAAVRRLN